jgi:apolipoprotein N-acyltransferase
VSLRTRLAALDGRFVRSAPKPEGPRFWRLLALGWAVVSVMAWLGVAFGDAGALGLTVAIGTSLLSGFYLASSLALRRQRERERG